MKMMKLCQGAVIFTALHGQNSAFAEPRNEDVKGQDDASPTIEESRVATEPSFFDLLLPDMVMDLVNRNALEHGGNQPIC